MRVVIKETEVYEFSELNEQAQQKALDHCRYWNTDHEWYDIMRDDAENIGLSIRAFDLDKRTLESKANLDPIEMAHKIKENHGEQCDTYKIACEFLQERDNIAPVDANGEFEDVEALSVKLDEVEQGFIKKLNGEYFTMLRNEYEYLTSDEAVKEMIEANGYEFTADGELILTKNHTPCIS